MISFLFAAFIALVFLGIGFLVDEKNANYLLSGYNTMSKADQAAFDLKGYLRYFRRFHVFLAVSFFIGFSILLVAVSAMWANVFLAVYPISAYVFFIFQSNNRFPSSQAKKGKWAAVLLVFVAVGVLLLFWHGSQQAQLKITDQGIEISGMYGVEVAWDEIESILLMEQLPDIGNRTNGFAVAPIFKGHFKSNDGQRYLLNVVADCPPFVALTLTDGRMLIFNECANGSAQEIVSKASTYLGAQN